VVLLTGGSILAVVALWQNFVGTVPRPINWLIVAITFVVAAFHSWRDQYIQTGSGFISVDFDFLTKQLYNLTDIQRRVCVKPYVHKWVRLTGELHDVWAFFLFGKVTLLAGRPGGYNPISVRIKM
jgi:hypothetical protein